MVNTNGLIGVINGAVVNAVTSCLPRQRQPSTNECQDMESMTRCFNNFGYAIAFKILIIILRYISSTKKKVNISMTRGHRKLLC